VQGLQHSLGCEYSSLLVAASSCQQDSSSASFLGLFAYLAAAQIWGKGGRGGRERRGESRGSATARHWKLLTELEVRRVI